jgi:hypothetical protein
LVDYCQDASVQSTIHVYEVRPRKDKRGFDLISDALPFGRLWYGEQNAIANAIGYAKFYSRSHHTVIRVYDEAANVIGTHEHTGDFTGWQNQPDLNRMLLLSGCFLPRCPPSLHELREPLSSRWCKFAFLSRDFADAGAFSLCPSCFCCSGEFCSRSG